MNAQDNRMLWNCEVRGIACEYGICDECPNTRGRDDYESEEKEEKA